MKALLVVDVQNDFMPGGALGVAGGDETVPLINQLMDRYERVIATQDWHPADHGSFARQPEDIGKVVDLNGLDQVLWPVHCVQDSFGAAFFEGLRTDRFDAIFHKGTDPEIDSYSAVFDNGKRKSTGLDRYLREQQVDEVHLVGLATDYCVKYSALDLVGLGIDTTVVVDACRGVDLNPGDVNRAIEEMKAKGVRVVTSDGLLKH